ncbi:penicillin-binding protein 2 [Fictibacillus sp. Mic-4]|uniref:peptidoglycan D,D-transpeptidase FtsI family protein n=1 Tax=Fictibacillus sp. Mic-4 TaxID=3132826 RepID=UPI003CF05FAB
MEVQSVNKMKSKIKKKKSHLPLRLNILFLSVFALFSILILRLGVLQIVHGEEKRLESEAVEKEEATKESPRGIIYDRHHRVVVDNKPFFTLTYTKTKSTTPEDTMRVAKWLSRYIKGDQDKITESDKKDYFIAKQSLKAREALYNVMEKRLNEDERANLDAAKQYKLLKQRITAGDLKQLPADDVQALLKAHLSKEELQKSSDGQYKLLTERLTENDLKKFGKNGLQKLMVSRLSKKELKKSDSEQYKILKERITKDDLKTLTKDDFKVLAIKRNMDQGSSYTAQPVIKGLTNEQIAVISENLDQLPGVEISPDADRKYPYGESLKTIFGNIKQMPKEKQGYYLARNYDLSDQVGVSGLEQQYEDVLRGTKEKTVYKINPKNGETIGKPKVIHGKRGKDLVLTVDMELQSNLEKIVEKEIKTSRTMAGNEYVDRAYIVMMNPKTGEIYAMAGKTYDKKTGKFHNDSYGALFNAYAMGSTVKGATILTGFQKGVIHPGTVLYDTPLKFGQGKPKKSWKNMGYIDDLEALKMSSNVYNWRVAMMLGKYDYDRGVYYGKSKTLGFDVMRYYFSQFGLGVKTGVDFPNEATGYNGGYQQLGNMIDMAIGQFDTYTPLQLVQYVSVIANGGYRVQPHLLQEIREPSPSTDKEGKLIEKVEPHILNKVDMKEEYIDRVRQGFYQVMHSPGGTAYKYGFHQAKYHDPAGKTGTAQVYVNHGQTEKYNITMVGFAPFKNPEVAFAIAVPNVSTYSNNDVAGRIGTQALDTYWKLKEKYKEENQSDN